MPNSDLSYSMLVARFIESGQWDRALESAREWLAANPQNSGAHLAAGQALINLERKVEADIHISQVLRTEPENAFAHRLMSIVRFDQKRFKEADTAIQQAIALAPNDAYNWYHLALMCYRQGDLQSATAWAQKARELSPLDPSIINLLAMCAPDDANPGAGGQLRQYEEALELDPENATVHNNIGVHYLNVSRDYAAAENSFRFALALEPANPVFRSNLFVAIKQRDRLYRILCGPRDLLAKFSLFTRRTRERSKIAALLLIAVWIITARFFFFVLILWLLFVWPMIKVYEKLTVGDLRAKAGEIGARRGGFLNYRCWPLKVRLAIFGALLIGFWSALWQFSELLLHESVIGIAVCAIIAVLVYQGLRTGIRGRRDRIHAKKRARALKHLLKPNLP
jgi:Flp pilus assembly protein TadD